MAYILNIETATKNCSVSVAKDGITLCCNEMAEEGYSHAERLHVFIETTLASLQLSFEDIAAIAVSQGPGSYTGLRIGLSAAKGLCFALDIPLIAVDTLAVLAAKITIPEGLIIPMIDARRMEVYSAVFNATHQKIREVKAEIISENSFIGYDEAIYFIGDCSAKCKGVLTKPNFIFRDDLIYPSANEMGFLSNEQYEKSNFVNVAYFEPCYLKDFVMTVSKK